MNQRSNIQANVEFATSRSPCSGPWLVGAVFIAVAFSCLATDYTWNGGSGDWSVAGSWTPNGVPGSTDSAKINSGNAIVSTDTSVDTVNLGGGTVTGTGTLTVSNTLNWTDGTMSGSGRTVIAPGATLNLSNQVGDLVINTRTLENGGTVIWNGSHNLCLYSAMVTNRAGALWEARNDGTFIHCGGGGPVFDNAGTFRKTMSAGTTTFTSGTTFNNYGTVEVQTGTLVLRNGAANGTFDVATGARLEWQGSYTVDTGAQLVGAGIYANKATLNVNGAVGAVNLDLAGTLSGTGTLTVSNTLNWTGGTMSGNGRTVIAPGATLNLSNQTEDLDINTRTLENGGTVIWNGSYNLCLVSAVVTNRAGALWEARNDGTFIHCGGGGPVFDNAGTFRKTMSTGTTTFTSGTTFNNYGTVEAQSGMLQINQFNNVGTATVLNGAILSLTAGGSGTGLFDVQNGGRLSWSSGSFSLNSGAQLNTAGSYSNAALLSVNTAIGVQNLDLTGTLSGTGTLTVSNTLNWSGGTMSGSGRTVIAPGATLNLSNQTEDLDINTRTLENGGTVIWNGSYNLCLVSAVVTNRAGALWEARNDGTFIHCGGGGPVFDNAGTFRKTMSTGTTTFTSGTIFNNYGMLEILSGVVSVNGGFSCSSHSMFNSAIGGKAPGTGFGQLQISGAVTLNGSLSVDLVNGFYPATNDMFTVLTAGTRSGTFSNFYYPSNDVGMAVTNTPSSVFVQVINVRPTIPLIGSQTNQELVLFSLNVNATDDDSPPQALTYALTNSPEGTAIDPNGQVTWTPTEEQGPLATNITVLVTDDGMPNLTASRTFSIFINESNQPPVLTLPTDIVTTELVALGLSASATDADIPANPLRFDLVSGPQGLTVSSTGDINWTPTEAQGSNDYVVAISVTDTNADAVNAKELSVTNTFTITANEVNESPTIIVPADQTVLEETAVTLTNLVNDPDVPANTFNFELLSAPPGMTINAGNGVISWTPDETQGSNTFSVTVRVTDLNPLAINATQLSDTNTFAITVNESNRPPVLMSPTDQALDELTTRTVTNSATDPDQPANPLAYALINAPTGAVISAEGVITWTPSEAQGPSTNVFITVVTDTNALAVNETSLSTTNMFSVVVGEVNVAPELSDLTNRAVNVGDTLNVTNTATDADLPANGLSYALIEAPAGATISSDGVIQWTPAGPSTNIFTTVVTDDGGSALSDTNSFTVVANRLPIPLNPALGTSQNRPVNLPVVKLATDPDGHPLSFTVSPDSAEGGAAILLGGNVTYTPPTDFIGADTFTYTVDDGFGGMSNGTVSVSVVSSNAASLNIVFGPTIQGGDFVVRFAGIPGRTYTIEWSDSATGPWAKSANLTAPTADEGHGIGVFEFSEPIGGAASRFYRTVYPSY